jgi:hypothetical protein
MLTRRVPNLVLAVTRRCSQQPCGRLLLPGNSPLREVEERSRSTGKLSYFSVMRGNGSNVVSPVDEWLFRTCTCKLTQMSYRFAVSSGE